MTKKISPIIRDRAIEKVLRNVAHLERQGVKVDGNLAALAYWLADPDNGNLEARIKFGVDEWSQPVSPVCIGLVYEQSRSPSGCDTTWDKKGGDEFRRLKEVEREARLANMCVRHIHVDPQNLGGFLKEWGLPKLEMEQLRAVLDGVEATDVSAERVEIAKVACGMDAVWGNLSRRPFNNEEYLKVLVNHCSPELRERMLQAPDNIRVQVVQHAIYHDRIDWVRDMLDRGLSVDAYERIYGWRLLHIAASANSEATKMLLARGADIHVKDGSGCTPLHHAIDDVEACRALLEKGAQLHALDDRWFTPLHGMLECPVECQPVILKEDEIEKRVKVINLMLDHGADPFYAPEDPPINYLTPFQYAVKNGSIKQVGAILRRFEVDLGQRTLSDRTLAQIAGKNKAMKDYLRSAKTEISIREAISLDADTVPKRSRGMAPL